MPEEKARQQSRQAIFKEDPARQTGEGEHLSLRAYIAEHLQKKAETPQQRAFNPYEHGQFFLPDQALGGYLNKLDVNFGEGLEHLLPTPAIRYKVIKSRLNTQIAQVQAQLNRHRGVPHPTAETQAQIATLAGHLAILRAHDQEVSMRLQQMFGDGGTIVQLGHWRQAASLWASGLLYGLQCWWDEKGPGVQSAAIRTLCREIREIQTVLDEQMRRPGISPAELSHLIVESEQKIRQLEARASESRQSNWKNRLTTGQKPL